MEGGGQVPEGLRLLDLALVRNGDLVDSPGLWGQVGEDLVFVQVQDVRAGKFSELLEVGRSGDLPDGIPSGPITLVVALAEVRLVAALAVGQRVTDRLEEWEQIERFAVFEGCPGKQ